MRHSSVRRQISRRFSDCPTEQRSPSKAFRPSQSELSAHYLPLFLCCFEQTRSRATAVPLSSFLGAPDLPPSLARQPIQQPSEWSRAPDLSRLRVHSPAIAHSTPPFGAFLPAL